MNNPADLRRQYEQDGFTVAPPVVPADLVQRAVTHMDAVLAGQYETGIAPLAHGGPITNPTKLVKIDQAHLADRTLFEFCTHPAIGRWAAAITGAQLVQLWAVQQLYKPPGGSDQGNVGWHQDFQYWHNWWTPDSEVFTCWAALVDVSREMGPMLFARGSHRWGFLNEGDFFSVAINTQRETILKKYGFQWDEVPAVMPAGAVSYHHKYTYHGSGPNVSRVARRSFALHLRTEKSEPIKGSGYYTDQIDNPAVSPVIYRAA